MYNEFFNFIQYPRWNNFCEGNQFVKFHIRRNGPYIYIYIYWKADWVHRDSLRGTSLTFITHLGASNGYIRAIDYYVVIIEIEEENDVSHRGGTRRSKRLIPYIGIAVSPSGLLQAVLIDRSVHFAYTDMAWCSIPTSPKGARKMPSRDPSRFTIAYPTLTFDRASIDPDLRSRTPPAHYSMYYTAVHAASTSSYRRPRSRGRCSLYRIIERR